MIGIQYSEAGSAMVLLSESEFTVIGQGQDLEKIAQSVRDEGSVFLDSAALGIPAWFNDTQRAEARDRILQLGFKNVRVVNEPTAIAEAYNHSVPQPLSKLLIVSLSPHGSVDITAMSCNGGYGEIHSTSGIQQLKPDMISDSSKLLAAVEPHLLQVVADAKIESFDAVILGGATVALRDMAECIEAITNLKPAEPPQPEIAIALGAALWVDRLSKTASSNSSTNKEQSKLGCLGLVAVVAGFGFASYFAFVESIL